MRDLVQDSILNIT